jgi:hypothetical protein
MSLGLASCVCPEAATKKGCSLHLLNTAGVVSRVNIETGSIRSDEIIRRGGTIAPSPFVAMIAAVYLLGFAGQWFTVPLVLVLFGLWPFMLLQVVMIAVWYVLHARRLRDAGRNIAPARGVAAIHILAIVLLVLVGAFYMDWTPNDGRMPDSLLLVQQLITFSRGTGDLLTMLGLVACVALLVPPVFSIWAAMQRRRPA